jgi:hypothetical protein
LNGDLGVVVHFLQDRGIELALIKQRLALLEATLGKVQVERGFILRRRYPQPGGFGCQLDRIEHRAGQGMHGARDGGAHQQRDNDDGCQRAKGPAPDGQLGAYDRFLGGTQAGIGGSGLEQLALDPRLGASREHRLRRGHQQPGSVEQGSQLVRKGGRSCGIGRQHTFGRHGTGSELG